MADVSITAEDILRILPHRYPFLLIDKVCEVEKDRIVCVKNVSFGEPYFQGHFPGNPIMPGVLQVEAMAQAGGILAQQNGAFDVSTHVVLFMGMDKVKFRRPVRPGDQLTLDVKALRIGRISKFAGRALVDGEVASEAELLATLAPKESVP